MRLTNQANFDIYFCDEKGSLERPNGIAPEKINKWRKSGNSAWTKNVRAEVALLQKYVVEKPDWLISAERSARRFVRGLGLEACRGAQVTLVDVTNPDDVKKIFPYDNDVTSTDAQNSYYYGILLRQDRTRLAYAHKGRVAVGRTIVHELTHAAEWQSPTVLNFYDSEADTWVMASRQGQMLNLGGTSYGQFFSEGVAEFNAGLFTRRQQHPNCPIVSITDCPTLELPAYYSDYRPDKGVPYVVGPDGYGVELLAWGMQEKGVTSAEDFISKAHATYSQDPSVRLDGLRRFATHVDAIRPGLYRDLRNLEYGHQAWQEGLRMIHEAVVR